VIETLSPRMAAWRTISTRSGRLAGSPPVRTKSGAGTRPAKSSMRAKASSVRSSSGWRIGTAAARQCLQARSQARVISQMTMKGALANGDKQ